MDHCAINIHIAGPDGELWVFTEYPRGEVSRDASHLRIGGTTLVRRDGELHIEFDERTKPFFQRMPRRVAGRIRLIPQARFDHPVQIDPRGQHTWWGVAPHARVEVELDQPGLRFVGSAYHDANRGHEGLEDGFRRWTWSRAELPEGAVVLYDTEDRDGRQQQLGFLFRPDGRVESFEAPQRQPLSTAGWGIDRETRVDAGGEAEVVRTLVPSPFYARSVIRTRLGGQTVIGVHEALDCDRFDAGWVRFLLPWRIRRAAR